MFPSPKNALASSASDIMRAVSIGMGVLMGNCKNCRYAGWAYTSHKPPRIIRNIAGRCLYVVKESALFNVVPAIMFDPHVNRRAIKNLNLEYRTLWWDRLPETCAVWAEKCSDTM
jgi:hypothetical protein